MYKASECSHLRPCVSTPGKGTENTPELLVKMGPKTRYRLGSTQPRPTCFTLGYLCFCLLLSFPLHPPPKSYFTDSLTREISVRTMKIWVFRRNAHDSVTVAKSGFQKALVTGLLNWNNVCVPEKRKKWTPPRDIGRFPSLLFIRAANCVFCTEHRKPQGEKSFRLPRFLFLNPSKILN